MFAIGLLAYSVAVFQRASLGVAAVEAQHRFHTTAAALSLLSVTQLVVYAGLQIPVGTLLDRIGSRRLIVVGALVMALGQTVFATVDTLGPAVLGRVLVGAGDAMTFICVLRLIPAWFPARQVPVLSQLIAILGQVGQLAAAYPLIALLQAEGWTTSFIVAAAVGLAVAGIAAAGLRNTPPGTVAPAAVGVEQVLTRLRHAWQEPGTRLGLWTHFVTQFSGAVFTLLWGYPFLVQGEGCSPAQAGLLLTLLVVVAMLVAPVLGRIAIRWPFRRSVPTLAIVAATAGAWTLVLAWPGRAPIEVLVLLAVTLSSNGPGSVMGFDYARTENEPDRIGSASGIVNVGGFVATLSTTALIGIVLTVSGSAAGHYTLEDFKLAFSVQYLFWAIGLVAVLRSRRRLRTVRGLQLDPFHRAVARQWRGRRR